jgi:hypothetical protein
LRAPLDPDAVRQTGEEKKKEEETIVNSNSELMVCPELSMWSKNICSV